MIKKIFGIMFIGYGAFALYGAYASFIQENNIVQTAFSGVFGFIFLILGFVLMKKKKEKNEPTDQIESNEENIDEEAPWRANKKPFPKGVMTFLVFIVSIGLAFGLAYLDKDLISYNIGEFVLNNALIFLGIYLIIGFISCHQLSKYDSYDTKINSAFIFKNSSKIKITSTFFNYFGSAYAQGPLIYGEKDQHLLKSRKRYLIFMLIYRYTFTMLGLIGIIRLILEIGILESYDEMLNLSVYSKGALGFFIMILCPSIDIFFYMIRKVLPFFEAKQYKVTTYYTDGSSESETKTKSNIIALFMMGSILFVYYVGWFWGPTSRNIVRLIESKRFNKYCNEYENVDIMDYYRLKGFK